LPNGIFAFLKLIPWIKVMYFENGFFLFVWPKKYTYFVLSSNIDSGKWRTAFLKLMKMKSSHWKKKLNSWLRSMRIANKNPPFFLMRRY